MITKHRDTILAALRVALGLAIAMLILTLAAKGIDLLVNGS